ncbi:MULTISPECIES: GntR family transcriptional regulator [Paenibacillus]|uniref:GntR family transcriptional regulator n=1 Tax=Paenibacillus radicis (ex Xue et al. 2023) TaxID=2972489 RepID=A0ABT1YKH9_9BACL|nr:GntR family transcriptional regulator [Paenibacillus radicis (ex Xue et al. 2023)]MCR8633692.1 GntR family transcriptional regulator [Paenibacillus radicis (ex Xue et al. 2023)]
MANQTKVSHYIKIKESLDAKMKSGELKLGDRLPAEIELAHQFQVSRETVRAAMKQLELEGKLDVRKGVGRFVKRPLSSIPSSIDRFTSTEEIIRSAGLVEGQLEQYIRTEPCQEEWAQFLKIPLGSPVIVNERTRTANEEPVAHNINIMPLALVEQAFQTKTFTGSLLRFLEVECGIRLTGANTELVVPHHTDPICRKLQVKRDTTVLMMKQIHFDQQHMPVLFSYDYYRNDVFQFWVNRRR